MKTFLHLLSMAAVLTVLGSCSTTLSFRAGVHHGGIVENTDMSVVPGSEAPPEATVDAFTGATRTGTHAGIRLEHEGRVLSFSSGLDYLRSNQSFYYIDAGLFHMGQRDVTLHQRTVPLEVGLPLFRGLLPRWEGRWRIGYLQQFNSAEVMDSGILPDYRILPRSGGLTTGFSFSPVHFPGGSRLGFYADVYRGSQIYEDLYNQAGFEMPGSSSIRAGLLFSF
ncbi:MAG: hypothetical protein R2751_00855 [Bacteroidales bacterium]